MVSFDLDKILHSVIVKAEEDSIISSDERDLIETLKIEGANIQQTLNDLNEDQSTGVALKKVLANSSMVLFKNLISKAREDGRLTFEETELLELIFRELGFELGNFNSRPWFNFKICININDHTDMEELLSVFDRVFCLRGIDPTDVYAGLCLGTKHYVIEDVDITLLSFAVTPTTDQEWVTKGAFAVLDTGGNFERVLYNTAYDLAVENYFSKL